ncbi:hypothetical protein F7U66_01395 [Vibrio parahaemolyticus]|nr:hypothetical protein [Vibrio parahaemolyticus]
MSTKKKCFDASCAWVALMVGVVTMLPLIAHAIEVNFYLEPGTWLAIAVESGSLFAMRIGPLNLCLVAAIVPVCLLTVSGVSIKDKPDCRFGWAGEQYEESNDD